MAPVRYMTIKNTIEIKTMFSLLNSMDCATWPRPSSVTAPAIKPEKNKLSECRVTQASNNFSLMWIFFKFFIAKADTNAKINPETGPDKNIPNMES